MDIADVIRTVLAPSMLLAIATALWYSLENSGVIVLINIICAIVFATRVEKQGQWDSIACSVRSVNDQQLEMKTNNDNVIEYFRLSLVPRLSHTCDEKLGDGLGTRLLQSSAFFPLQQYFRFGGSLHACSQDWRTCHLFLVHRKWVCTYSFGLQLNRWKYSWCNLNVGFGQLMLWWNVSISYVTMLHPHIIILHFELFVPHYQACCDWRTAGGKRGL